MHPNNPSVWTAKEDDRLREILEAGLGTAIAAIELKRTPAGIRARAAKLRIAVRRPALPSKPDQSARAKELASKQIEKLVDVTVSPEEKATRKRRLVEGPSSFREVRLDRLKNK